ncbi:hypothetical protein [Cohnella sp.]|uniref:hypothetical protein n=1 Tax=Cohnella sp. TaxID=1883426 RepID=UPI0037048176
MEYLLNDPRPDLPDTQKWQLLLRLIPLIEDKARACQLHKLLWSFRCYGTILKYNASGLYFWISMDERCPYDNEAEFEIDKKKYFTPYREEISWLIRKVEGQE